jgi:hypothetical protein
MTGSQQPPGDRLIAVWLVLGIIFALLVGIAGGVLGWLGGERTPIAVLTGGGAFGATVLLVIAIIRLLQQRTE